MIQSFKEFIAWEVMNRQSIDFKVCYVDIAGDLIAGLLLSQIIYWHLPSKQTGETKLRVKRMNKLWIAKKREDWYFEIRISPKQYDRAAKILEEKSLITIANAKDGTGKKWKFRGVPTIHISLNIKTLIYEINKISNDIQVNLYPEDIVTGNAISFNDFWDLYDKKVGSLTKLKKKWDKIPDSVQKIIMTYIPKYKESQPDKIYRKNPDTFLNNQSWNDEIIQRTDTKKISRSDEEKAAWNRFDNQKQIEVTDGDNEI
jgi:hypothetical protein